MTHVVLLGDSIFDNRAYVDGPDVIAQLRRLLPPGASATLLAVDGSMMSDIPAQLEKLPADASHLVVSIGGNDALDQAGVLQEVAGSMAFALDRMMGIGDRFRRDYGSTLDRITAMDLPVAVCTIYDPRFPDPLFRRIGAAALTSLNDAITREAFTRGLPVVDLRMLPDEAFANEIEPSIAGGEKIAAAISTLVKQHDFVRRTSAVFVA